MCLCKINITKLFCLWLNTTNTESGLILKTSGAGESHSSGTPAFTTSLVGRVWRYQSGNQKPYIKEEQTTQWPQEKRQKDKQRSTKYYI